MGCAGPPAAANPCGFDTGFIAGWDGSIGRGAAWLCPARSSFSLPPPLRLRVVLFSSLSYLADSFPSMLAGLALARFAAPEPASDFAASGGRFTATAVAFTFGALSAPFATPRPLDMMPTRW